MFKIGDLVRTKKSYPHGFYKGIVKHIGKLQYGEKTYGYDFSIWSNWNRKGYSIESLTFINMENLELVEKNKPKEFGIVSFMKEISKNV